MDSPAPEDERARLRAALEAFLDDLERLDVEGLGRRLADDVELRLGNAPPVVGRGPATAALRRRWSAVEPIERQRLETLIAPPRAVHMSVVTYALPDGRQVHVRDATHLRWTADGLIGRLWVYEDAAELAALGPDRA
jgi:hypothetical protein